VALTTSSLTLTAVPGIPAIREGDDLGRLIGEALVAADLRPRDGDVLVITHKIISKAEGRIVVLKDVQPTAQAIDLAEKTGKDPAVVALILSESRKILRHRPGLIIAEHRLGMVMANAGIDQSNVAGGDDEPRVLLLPEDPDASAAELQRVLEERFAVELAVVVADSVGRAWRNGVVGLAIGAAGLPALLDLRGRNDLDGRELKVTQVGYADQIASAAELLMGEADEGAPAVLLRGLNVRELAPPAPARALVREAEEDLFR
jgi:coenzyme F420-0:L-glutamate ligase/coenzyme F420-1:gamma-L-glutamate ligase